MAQASPWRFGARRLRRTCRRQVLPDNTRAFSMSAASMISSRHADDASPRCRPRMPIMVNLGNPDLAFRTAMRSNDGVGLARIEFIISEHIGIHPMALMQPEKVTSPVDRDVISARVARYSIPTDFFIETLAEGVGMIAAAFTPSRSSCASPTSR